jgi:hypothetical protein
LSKDGNGRITAVKSSVIAGFVRGGRFYTREEAAQEVASQTTQPQHHFALG